MTPRTGTPAPPKKSLLLLESRAALDVARMLVPLAAASVRQSGTARFLPDRADVCQI